MKLLKGRAAAKDSVGTEKSWGLDRGDEIDPTLVVIDPIGGGYRYEVFHAWDRTLFCEVAVKMVRPHRVADERAMQGFERELGHGRRLAHPNLVRLLRWDLARRPFMVLEYVTAQTLEHHLRDIGAVSIPETCLLGVRMCSALHYLHSNGVLHLDVKPANLTMGDPPRLLDLGLARTAVLPQRLADRVGTTAYMAPEQCTKDPVSPATDLFGLGVTLYEALSGGRPFGESQADSDVPEEKYPQLRYDAVPPGELKIVPPRLERLVMSLLERDASRRPRSAVAVALELEAVLEELRTDELLAWPRGLKVTSA